MEILIILKNVILPIFVIMGIGFVLEKKFALNVQTLAKMNIYFFVPGFIFVKLYSTHISLHLFGNVFLFFVLLIVMLYVLSIPVAKSQRLDKKEKITFSNSVMFFNSGNYGVPVNDLVFKSDPVAMSVQVIVLTLQNIFLFSYGIFSLQSAEIGKLKALLGYFRMPVLYALLAGVLCNVLHVSMPEFIWIPANYISEGMISVALLTLGAQVANLRLASGLSKVYCSLLLRLVGGPVIAFVIIVLFGVKGMIAQALLVASAMPTSVNSSVIAQEYHNHPELAAQIVLFSTLFSSFTVTMTIYFARLFF